MLGTEELISLCWSKHARFCSNRNSII